MLKSPPEPESEKQSIPFVPPRTEVEKRVSGIWVELLKIGKIGIHDNFFELGGHSLLAMQVISRLQNIYPVDLSINVLFDAPTVFELSNLLETLIPEEFDHQVSRKNVRDGREQGEV